MAGVLGWSTMGEVDKDKYEEQDDGLNVDQAEAEKESIRPIEAVEEEQGEEEANKKLDPEEDLDLAPPELVNLIFSTGLRDDKSATVLEAIQDVVLYCQSLNIPVLRFHSDRGMEYQVVIRKRQLEGPIADVVEADEPAGPSHRVRGKASGSGDVVTVSKAVIFEDELYKQRAEKILDSWSQEEAEVLVKEVGSLLPPAESVYGMFRHGGRTGITRATAERPWFAQLLIRLLRDRASDAEFASIYLSVNSEREVHIDRNNAMGTLNYVLPIVMPRRGGEIWQELRNGDTVSGRISELTSPDGKVRYGCAFPLQEGCVFHLNPHRRHAVLPYKGDRVVVVGYTPGVLQNVTRTDREFLWTLGFPMPLVDEDGGGGIRISMLSVGKDLEADLCAFPFSQEEPIAKESTVEDTQGPTSFCEVQHEEWADWEMRLLLDQDQKETVLVESDVMKPLGIYKTEVSYTENIEQLLEALDGPLSIVHTVSPKDAADHFEKWVPSLEKEIASLAHAVQKAHVDDVEVKRDVETGKGQMIPMKVVFTVKPPDVTQDGASATSFFKRKSRIVICGNLATHQPGDVYTNTAPAEVVRAAIALARFFRWNLGMIDVVAAFLQTPLKELSGAPLVYGIPPKILIKAGLCRPGELWKLTHAVYGLQESPNLWGTYRDQRLAGITFMLGDKTITLVQGKVEPSWWSVMQDGTMLVGILVVYVDDLLICGEADVIKGVTAAIRSLWKTSDLQLVSEGTIRFLGIEISEYKEGLALSQSSFFEELVRLHNIPASRRDLIPVAKDQATFLIEEEEKIFTVAELRTAQQCAGELLWVSQRTRPDISYVASLVGSLATRAPRRAIQIAEKAIAYLQRTMGYSLIYQTDGSGLVAYCDASFAPEGGRSHSGWIVLLHDCVIAWRSGRQATVTLSTAEAELMAMSEAVLALQSTDSMMKDMFPEGKQLQLYSDSTSALAIANGSGSWRTRHLRLRSAWVAELISNQAMTVHHCVGEVQPADLLTKALASQRIKSLCSLLNLKDTDEENFAGEESRQQTSSNSRSSTASAPNQIPKVLIALLVLSQAVLGESHEWEREDAFMVTSSLSVDYGMITWALLWSAVIVFLLAWELVKWLLWLLYDRATPGSKSRRLKRLRKLREATADAIQREIQSRSGSSAEQRARDSQVRHRQLAKGQILQELHNMRQVLRILLMKGCSFSGNLLEE
ncbi:Retrovirus-related Pol polyprotein from transposon TNT 1-94 [Symbiodinium microadriaticum]|uniref:Retrovirus-related Pol polyprotein from transposon TNT 1-94 n=1 Tax=Symbiodinium microadriaticum TaxID=2951 RepID=A0A1Q9DRV8_SYMMI|nr:Retrovirus-related Pol polyprotein from transposon TNT 1-94 [Symbiodinium microadriaticum]